MAGSRARTPETGTAADTTADMPASTSALQPPPDRSNKKRIRERSNAAKDRSEEEKSSWVDEWIGVGEEGEETTDQAKKEDAGEEKLSGEEEEEEVVSSAPSSPLRAPYMPDELIHTYNRAYKEAFDRVEAKYNEKRARQKKLPTLDEYKPHKQKPHVEVPKPRSIHVSERKMLLRAAEFVVGVSSSVGGEPLRRCSGFWIDWDEDSNSGIVLTAAKIMLNKYAYPLEQEYAHDAKVIVHLRGDITAEAHLLYYQQHYNLALFRVTGDQPIHLPSFNDDEVQCDQEIFEIGRDKESYLRIDRGRVEYPDRKFYDGYHDVYIVGGHKYFEHSEGGPVIDFDGNVVGVITSRGSFMVSSILLKCLHIWRKFRCIPRPNLGLHFCAIRLLDIAIAEKISAKCNVDEGLIVKEVSKGSHAEKLGIRVGDIIECFNGEHICNPLELENVLLSTCEGHLDKGNVRNSKVDIVVRVFHTRKGLRSIKTLTVDLSEHKEEIGRVYYPFTIGEGGSASESLDEVSSG